MGCTDNTGSDARKCVKSRDEGSTQCSQSRDDGYSSCSRTEDQGYSSCDGWGPFSFVCQSWTWISNIVCAAWTWVANVVCVAWSWVSHVVCIVWAYSSAGLCAAIDLVTAIANAVVTTVEGLVSFVLNAVAFVVLAVLLVPGVGRLIQGLWNSVLTLIYAAASVPDFVGSLIGFLPEKRMRLVVINQKKEDGTPVATEADLLPSIALAIQVYREQANIRVLPLKPFRYRTAFAGEEQASDDYILNPDGASDTDTLDVDCNITGLMSDIAVVGSKFNFKLLTTGFWTSFRRLVGYGAPIGAFSVRSFPGTIGGCSQGPLTDYVLVEFTGAAGTAMPPTYGTVSNLTHEMGHACGLLHVDPPNLMESSAPRSVNLDSWQVALIRSSRHVTFL